MDVATEGSLDPTEALRIAAGVERDSEHTIAQGIVKSAEEQRLAIPGRQSDHARAKPPAVQGLTGVSRFAAMQEPMLRLFNARVTHYEPCGEKGEGQMERDVVCGMQVDPAKAAGTSQYKGQTYYFCSTGCKAKFDANPGEYAK